eukprot:GHVU01059122.1.p1 GENE.GHVU01059122.1~~GHVU01059122.1.p1  ORF type:complete len:205 (+),score=25.74 GHVU01059122.1:293-907(+)
MSIHQSYHIYNNISMWFTIQIALCSIRTVWSYDVVTDTITESTGAVTTTSDGGCLTAAATTTAAAEAMDSTATTAVVESQDAKGSGTDETGGDPADATATGGTDAAAAASDVMPLSSSSSACLAATSSGSVTANAKTVTTAASAMADVAADNTMVKIPNVYYDPDSAPVDKNYKWKRAESQLPWLDLDNIPGTIIPLPNPQPGE